MAQPWLLSDRTRAALGGPDGQLLALIATAPGLGAPEVRPGAHAQSTSGEGRPLATAVADTVATGPSLALIGALAAIAVGAMAARVIRRRRSSL